MTKKEIDIYGRMICDGEKCPAFFEYIGNNKCIIKMCDANQMYFSKENTLCRLIKEYKIVKV
jgi:hypothetical protein